MANKRVLMTIDVTKVNKDKIKERRFTTKDGKEVIARDLDLELVELNEPKLIKEGDTWALYKTHFVSLPQTKEERENKVKGLIVGDGRQFLEKSAKAEPDTNDPSRFPADGNDIDFSIVPF